VRGGKVMKRKGGNYGCPQQECQVMFVETEPLGTSNFHGFTLLVLYNVLKKVYRYWYVFDLHT
jgi:hypothetical protein